MAAMLCIALGGGPYAAGAGGGSFAPFVNEASSRGVSYPVAPSPQPGGIYGYPCAWCDLDGDGDADLIAAGSASGTMGLWENLGGTFVSRLAGSGLPQSIDVSAIASADMDADGLPEVLLTIWDENVRLLRQAAPFQFVDITATSGLACDGPTRGATWADFDGDGWLDLFIARYAGMLPGTSGARSHLYLQVPFESRFIEAGAQFGIGDPAFSFLGSFIDFDRDTRNDLLLSNDRAMLPPHYQSNQAWRNGADGVVELSGSCGLDTPFYSMGLAPADFNRDGIIDIAATNVSAVDQPLGPVNPLFIAGTEWLYTEQAVAWQLIPSGLGITGWSVQAHDFDNDGHTDLAINNQFHANRLYRNTGSSAFTDITNQAAFAGPALPSFCSAAADFDLDGDVDLASLELGTSLRLLVNHEGEERASVVLEVMGEWPNTQAIGALVDADVGGVNRIGQVMAGGHGYMGQNEVAVHLGLGAAQATGAILVRWPYGIGARTLAGLAAGRWRVYPPSRLGDADGDYEVDGDDDAPFAACLDGSATGDCEMFDFDGNGRIDGTDAEAYAARRALSPADFDRDGTVGAEDLAAVLGAWATRDPRILLGGNDVVGGEELARVLADWTP